MGNPVTNFWKELRQRKVIRVAVAYLVIGWIVVEVSSVLLPTLLLPDWTGRLVLALVALGFPVALVLAWVFDLSPAGLTRESTGSKSPSADPSPDSSAARGPASDGRRCILVLPFANLSEDADKGFFSDGITEEILNLLARQPELRVVSRTTSFSLRNSELDLGAMARRMGVELVLEGSVRRVRNRVRISAQLIDAGSDTQIWSEQYDRELSDIFQLQGEIARRIVGALQLDPESCAVCTPPTHKIEAYDYYLRGRQYFHTLTRSSLNFARQMFQHAIEVDPKFALAYAGLADTESVLAQWMDITPERRAAADHASRRAVELAPDLSETRASRGHALSLERDYAAAAAEFQRALELDPQNYDALYLFGRMRFAEGRTAEAAEIWKLAHEAQPDEYQAISLRTMALRQLGRTGEHQEAATEAVRALQQRLELNPDDQRALHLGPGVLIDLGRTDEALQMVERLLALAPDDMSALYNAASSYAHAGDLERALATLQRRVELGGIYRDWVEKDPDFEGLHDDPRFQALLQRMN